MKSLVCAAALTMAVCSSSALAQGTMGHAGGNMTDEELIKRPLGWLIKTLRQTRWDLCICSAGTVGRGIRTRML